MTFEITDPARVVETDGFDLEDIESPQKTLGLNPFYCDGLIGYPYKVHLYAKVGLDRYNILAGTNYQLDRVIKYNMLMNCLSSYYITLVASEPGSSKLTFQVGVDEERPNRLGLKVSVARPKVVSASSTVPPSMVPMFRLPKELPEWPSRDAFTDGKRFHLLKDTDSIGLYLQIQVLLRDYVAKRDLPKLKILKVAIEEEDVVQIPNAKCEYVYITFNGIAIRGMSADFERKAIIRRVIDGRGYFSLLGGFPAEDTTMTTPDSIENFFSGSRSTSSSTNLFQSGLVLFFVFVFALCVCFQVCVL